MRARSDFTPRTALARVALTPERLHEAGGPACTSPGRADLPMSAAEREDLAGALLQEPLLSMVRAEAQGCADRAIRYFRQEGLTDGTPSALVDAGWGGRTAKAFDLLLAKAGGTKVSHLVMGITGTSQDLSARDGVDLVPWLFDQQTYPRSVLGLHSPNVLVEMLCAGTVGRTVDYEAHGDRVEPVLEIPVNTVVIDWGLPAIHATANRVAELVASHLPADPGSIDGVPFVWATLRAFWTYPSSEEVRDWGSFPWEESWRNRSSRWRNGSRHVLSPSGCSGERARCAATTAGVRVQQLTSSQPWRGLLTLRAWQDENRDRIARAPRRLQLEIAVRRPAWTGRRSSAGSDPASTSLERRGD